MSLNGQDLIDLVPKDLSDPYKDRVVNPLEASHDGALTELRSWIDHILVSPELAPAVVPGSAQILHERPRPRGAPAHPRRLAPTDHHPPYVQVEF